MTTPRSDPIADPKPGAASDALLTVEGLNVTYEGGPALFRRSVTHKAVDQAFLTVNAGQTLGLIGESGSGKTTLCKALGGLVKAQSGHARLNGHDLLARGLTRDSGLRRKVQMVFQDPHSSLDPGLQTMDLVREPLRIHREGSRQDQVERVSELLDLVGLSTAYMHRYPHQMSGGQLQRVAVARALALDPELLLADEPLSALDVSIQAQVSNLLMRLQEELGLSYLFVAHDLAAIKRLSDAVVVMFMGRVVEWGPAPEVYGGPAHPYTVALMSAVPQPTPGRGAALRLNVKASGDPSREGCPYRSRCWLYQNLGEPERCVSEDPASTSPNSRGAACHFSEEMQAEPEVDQVLAAAGLT